MFEVLSIIGDVLSDPKKAIPNLINEYAINPLQVEMQKQSIALGKNVMCVFELANDENQQKKPVIILGYMQDGKLITIDEPVFIENYLAKELKDNFSEKLLDTVLNMVAKQFNKENIKIDNVPALIGHLFAIMTNYIIKKEQEKSGIIKYLFRFKTADRSKGSVIFETCWYDDGKIETMNSIEPKNLYTHFENQAATSEKKK